MKKYLFTAWTCFRNVKTFSVFVDTRLIYSHLTLVSRQNQQDYTQLGNQRKKEMTC